MKVFWDDYIAHYGTLHKSGRYPWESGGTKDEQNRTFLNMVDKLKNEEGLSNLQIARLFKMSTTELIALKSNAKNAEKQANIGQAQRLSDKGWSNSAIGRHMNANESTVRSWLKAGALEKTKILDVTASMLKTAIDEKKYIDVGSGVEQQLAVSATKLSNAVKLLIGEGYSFHHIKVEQVGTGKLTTMKVLAGPGVPWKEVNENKDQIKLPGAYSEDGGLSYDAMQPPLSISSKRVGIKYAEDGGAAADGVIYIRPGVKDTSIGSAKYAQVRISVDGTHYLKGMAMYKDDLPAGVDLQFNTNKSDTGNKLDALKPVKKDLTNPFGSTVRQIGDKQPDGSKKLTSVMNIVNDEGDWDSWSKTLSSQMLSKQSPKLAEQQLDIAFQKQQREFEEIKGLTNPGVKKKLLTSFADGADSASVNLKAAALPRTQNRVILPITSMKPTEVYAPQFRNGEQVVLIRHPHGGKFEIPQLTVNNRQPEARKLLGDAVDAIGIHPDVAEKLSGADFDGDTVLVIPNNKKEIKTKSTLEGLKGFDPKREYPKYDGMPEMTDAVKGSEMGKISNLITDMTIRGANDDELASAIRHSMVVIDAQKHDLNYKQSAIDNRISALKAKYQFKEDGSRGTGASTLISRASSRIDVNERKQGYTIDPVSGKKVYKETGKQYFPEKEDKKTGEKSYPETKLNKRTGEVKSTIKNVTQESTKLAETDDAFTLSSGQPIEAIYAEHSNRMKALANQARLEVLATKSIPYSPTARVKYADQVKSLESGLSLALSNSPLERQAQIVSNAIIAQKRAANPGMESSEIKTMRSTELANARARVGAAKKKISITPEEWEAIQAGAVTNNQLQKILDNADLDKVKQLATPKVQKLMNNNSISRAIAMKRNGATDAEVADALGVSVSTLKRSLVGGDNDE